MKIHLNFFFFVLIMSTLLIMSSMSWLSIWMALEINLISFIAFILINKKSNLIEASIIYFIVQSMASIILFLVILTNMLTLKIFQQDFNWTFKMLILTLLMKMGAAPLHFWLPLMMEGMNWMNNYLLMTWQKLGPMILVTYNINYWLFLFISFSTIVGGIGGLNQSSIKKLMSFSSINQISWFLLAIFYKKLLWSTYFLFYFFIMINIILIFNLFNLNFINQLFMTNYNKMIIMFMFLSILSMGGLPPLLGFFPKMLIIMSMENLLLILLMIMMTLITLYYYLRLMYFLILMSFKTVNSLNNNNKNFNLIMKLSFLTNFFLLFIFLL